MKFFRQGPQSVSVREPGVLDTLRHEAAHVGQDGEHEGDPDHPEYQTEQPTSEGGGCEVPVTWK